VKPKDLQKCAAWANSRKAALKECDDLIKLFRTGYGSRAALMQALGLFDRAMEDYNQAIDREPHTAGPCWNRAMLHERLGNTRKALADYNMVKKLSIDPTFAVEAISKSINRLQQSAPDRGR
jgi:tetratricopeptide (TPR) repeat protein